MRLPSVSLFLISVLAAAPIAAAVSHPRGPDAGGCHANHRACHNAGPASTTARGTRARPAIRAFRNCAEARAAGAAPVRAGDPGYSLKLDRDRDGIGCE